MNNNLTIPKILLAITKSNWGGAQKYVYDLANGLVDEKFNVQVVLGGHGPLKEKLEKTEIPTISLPSLGRDIKFIADLKSAWHLYKIFKENKPDILHLNSSKMLALGAVAGKLAGINNIVYTAHGWAFNEDRSKLSKLILKLIYKTSFLFVNKIIFVSKQTKIQSEQNGFKLNPEKVKIVYNGIAVSQLYTQVEAREIILANLTEKDLTKFTEETNPVWVGTVAELHKSKGLTYAIQAISALPKNIHYFIIGGGEERRNLDLLITGLKLHDRVHLTGPINSAHKILPALDLFLLPSITEALPYVILEAGLATLPTIASEVGGIPEIIENNYSGLLIEPRSPENIASAINKLLLDNGKNSILGQNLHKTVLNKFSLEKMTLSTINIYLEML